MPVAGVFKVTNTVDKLVYVGGSKDIYRTWRDHQRRLEKGSHFNPALQMAWNRHGPGAFTFELVHQVISPLASDVRPHVRSWIKRLRAASPAFGYNVDRATLMTEGELPLEQQPQPPMGERAAWAEARFGLR